MKKLLLSVAALSLSALSLSTGALASQPKLVLQITVDQMRGDFVTQYAERMPKGGFRYLLDNGVVYTDAHHNHANTETVVGHATLATGAYPSEHGMVANVWKDRGSDTLVYNIEDADYRLLDDKDTADGDVDINTEIDPTQRAANSSGRSPANLLSSTFSDELVLATNGKAKVFGVSVKDRGAVTLAGHAGKAFWFSKTAQAFVTSNYYYDQYPKWVSEWNQSGQVQAYADSHWQLLQARERYAFKDHDDQAWETEVGDFGRTFPHAFGAAEHPYFSTLLTVSPAGDELTASFAKALIVKEQLGQDDDTDYLSVSFSSTDYVGHLFGPSSLEMEDNLLRLDRTLADFFKHVDKTVGLKNTLIVVSADHGSAEAAGSLQALNIPAQIINPKSWENSDALKRLKKQFGLDVVFDSSGNQQTLIDQYYVPYIYLNRKAIAAKKLDLYQVQQAVAAELMAFNGVALALGSEAIERGEFADTALTRKLLNNYHPKRSGDIYLIFEPHAYINEFDGLTVAATHGSVWRYDTWVPVIFAGHKLKPKIINRKVETVAVATTLSAYLGIKMPSAASGEQLGAVVSQKP